MATYRMDLVAGHLNRHKKARTFYSYDLYMDKKLGVEVEDEAIPITQFKAKNSLVFIAKQSRKRQNFVKHSFRQTHSSTYEVVGSWSNISLPFCTEVCKKLILSVIEGVKANLEDGNCFEQFDDKNLVVGPSGKVLFKHVRFFSATYEGKRAMWKNTHDFIKSLFGENTIPEDMEHLLGLINKQIKEPLYIVHPSLELHSERGWCFNKMYEHIKFKITAAQKNMILLKVPYHDKWRTIAKQNDVLDETINFKYSNYYRLPKFNEKGVPYTEIEIQLHEAEMFLDFIRHGTAHRLQRNISLTPHQHELILLVMYPLLLPQLQEAILDVLGVAELRKIVRSS